jgi:vacuolar-type H+-ATPase subunit I/STV1
LRSSSAFSLIWPVRGFLDTAGTCSATLLVAVLVGFLVVSFGLFVVFWFLQFTGLDMIIVGQK